MILIFPPIAKPSEPPAGVALLKAALNKHDIGCTVIDANIEALNWLLNAKIDPKDSWTKRALTNKTRIIKDIQGFDLYKNLDRYKQKIFDLNRILNKSSSLKRFKLSLTDYSDNQLSPVKSVDLLNSAKNFKENPFFDFFEETLVERIKNASSEYIGISLCYLNQALVSFAMAGWIKSRFPKKKIIMGGGLISSWMSSPYFLKPDTSVKDIFNPFEDYIDVIIKGEGEHALLNIFGVEDCNQKAYIPDYDFVKWDLYFAPGKILPFRSTIGCYWSKCRFCPEKAEIRPYKSLKSGVIIDELEVLNEKYQPEYVHFIDNAITPAVLKGMVKRNFPFKWYGFVRFTKELADEAFCNNLKKSGCTMLNLGLESGDQKVLDEMNKGTDLGLASKALQSLNKAGILTYVYLLFGTSFENEMSALKTMEFVQEHHSHIDYLNIAVFNLPKFSDDADNLKTFDFYEGDLSLYLNFEHPQGWDRKKVKQFLDKRFKKNKNISTIIKRNPPFFTSNHAMFFNHS